MDPGSGWLNIMDPSTHIIVDPESMQNLVRYPTNMIASILTNIYFLSEYWDLEEYEGEEEHHSLGLAGSAASAGQLTMEPMEETLNSLDEDTPVLPCSFPFQEAASHQQQQEEEEPSAAVEVSTGFNF